MAGERFKILGEVRLIVTMESARDLRPITNL